MLQLIDLSPDPTDLLVQWGSGQYCQIVVASQARSQGVQLQLHTHPPPPPTPPLDIRSTRPAMNFVTSTFTILLCNLYTYIVYKIACMRNNLLS